MLSNPDNIKRALYQALNTEVDLDLDEIVLSQRQLIALAEQSVSGFNADAKLTEPVDKIVFTSLAEHREAICNCHQCSLGETRTNFVYGVGHPNADLMLVGEAPGKNEDEQGEPFVGRGGQLLDKILAAIELSREQVYIANILKCRPPDNRDPQPDEMAVCFPYLEEQVRLIKPKLICALGRIAAQALLNTQTPLGKLRGEFHEYCGVPLLVTYHPAALLRFQHYKKDTWEDMKKLKAKLDKLTS